jgi:hypothetical protein
VDLFDVVRSCFRRWYIFLPLLLIVAWFSHSVYSSAKPVYYSQAVIGVAPPSVRVDDVAPGLPLPRNGLLDIGGAPLIANMAALGLREPSIVDNVVAAGGLPDYVSKMFPAPANQQLPLIVIDATDEDPAAVTKTLEVVIAQAGVSVRTLQQQARVPDDQMVAPFVVSPPSAPAAAMPTRTRSTIAIFVAGAGLSVLLTVLADVLLTRRKSRAQQRRQERSDAAAGPDPAHPPNEVKQPNQTAPVAERVMDAT